MTPDCSRGVFVTRFLSMVVGCLLLVDFPNNQQQTTNNKEKFLILKGD